MLKSPAQFIAEVTKAVVKQGANGPVIARELRVLTRTRLSGTQQGLQDAVVDLCAVIVQCAGTFGAADVCDTAGFFAQCTDRHWQLPTLALNRTLTALVVQLTAPPRLSQLDGPQCATLVCALAKLRFTDKPLLAALAEHAMQPEVLAGLSDTDIGNMKWAFAKASDPKLPVPQKALVPLPFAAYLRPAPPPSTRDNRRGQPSGAALWGAVAGANRRRAAAPADPRHTRPGKVGGLRALVESSPRPPSYPVGWASTTPLQTAALRN